jgi:hypothetical protein
MAQQLQSTTRMTTFKTLADTGALGQVLVRLMMAINDFGLANEALGGWMKERPPKLVGRQPGAPESCAPMMPQPANALQSANLRRHAIFRPRKSAAVEGNSARLRWPLQLRLVQRPQDHMLNASSSITDPDHDHGKCYRAELVDAPDSKFGCGRSDPFRSVPTSIDLYCENRPDVPSRPVRCWPVVTRSRPFW